MTKRPTVRAMYAKQLEEQNVIQSGQADQINEELQAKLKAAYEKVPPKPEKQRKYR